MLGAMFGFEGRVGRGTWWLGQLSTLIVGAFVLSIFVGSKGSGGFLSMTIGYIVSVVINVSVAVKRYHDRNKSGWWFFTGFIPIIGPFWSVIECGFCSGDDGDNFYGPPPGSARRASAFNDEMSSMSPTGRLAKIDDSYFESYKSKSGGGVMPSRESAVPQPARQVTNSFAQPGGKPAFGKR
jgi:uncharacterized membrane protein YhaH (DUF805 family)